MIYYNPLDKFYKSQVGAVCADKEITFRVKGNFDSVVFVLKNDGNGHEERFYMHKKQDFFELKIKFNKGLYFYYFDLLNGNFVGNSIDLLGIISSIPDCFQLTVYNKDYKVPEWMYGGVIYQIFPDRFYRADKEKNVPDNKLLHNSWCETPVYLPNEFGKIVNNDFFGGDLNGISEKLDYLSELGVTTIYLNPIFEAFSNHRYDTGDYMRIDSLLGSKKDFINLIEKANKLGIKLILDGVFNHTGDDSVYFNKYGHYKSIGAYQSTQSKYYEWYNFIDFPNKYDAWWGIETLPAINENNSNYIDFITGKNGVLDYYTKLGIGGWRLDVVDELPAHFVKSIRKAVKRANKNAIIIGEVWEDVSNKIAYGVRREYLQGEELDSAMNYPLKDAIIKFVKDGDSQFLGHVIKEQLDHYPKKTLHSMMNMLSTHDTMRILTVLGGKDVSGMSKKEMAETFIPEEDLDNAYLKLKIATLLQFTLCGVPSIYYGDEIGMQGYLDPLNRRTFCWDKIDNRPLLWYKKLIKIRKTYSAFKKGNIEILHCDDGLFVFSRKDYRSEIMVAVNLSKKQYTLEFKGKLFELLTEKEHESKFVFNENSFAVFVKKYKKR